MPSGTRAVFIHDKLSVFVVEEATKTRTVRWSLPNAKLVGVETRRILSFPWVVYIMATIAGEMRESFGRIFFRLAPIASLDDGLLLSPLCLADHYHLGPRIAGRVCFGSTNQGAQIPGESVHEILTTAMANVWATPHVTHAEYTDAAAPITDTLRRDMGYEVPERTYIPTAQIKADEWEKQTKEDGDFAMKFPWKPLQLSVRSAVDGLTDYLRVQGYKFSGKTLPASTTALVDVVYGASCG